MTQGELIPTAATTPAPVTTQTVSTQGGDLISRARELAALGDPSIDTFYEVVDLDTAAKKLRAAAVNLWVDVKKKTDEAHKAAVAGEKTLLQPIDEAREIFDKLMKRRRQLDLAESSQAHSATTIEHQGAIREARDAEVAALRASGQEEAAADLASQPLQSAGARNDSGVTKAPGLSYRREWTAKILNPEKVLEALALNDGWRVSFLTIDQSALDAAMQRTKGSLKIPFVEPLYDDKPVNKR